jgi:hypothetical protein
MDQQKQARSVDSLANIAKLLYNGGQSPPQSTPAEEGTVNLNEQIGLVRQRYNDQKIDLAAALDLLEPLLVRKGQEENWPDRCEETGQPLQQNYRGMSRAFLSKGFPAAEIKPRRFTKEGLELHHARKAEADRQAEATRQAASKPAATSPAAGDRLSELLDRRNDLEAQRRDLHLQIMQMVEALEKLEHQMQPVVAEYDRLYQAEAARDQRVQAAVAVLRGQPIPTVAAQPADEPYVRDEEPEPDSDQPDEVIEPEEVDESEIGVNLNMPASALHTGDRFEWTGQRLVPAADQQPEPRSFGDRRGNQFWDDRSQRWVDEDQFDRILAVRFGVQLEDEEPEPRSAEMGRLWEQFAQTSAKVRKFFRDRRES